MARTAREFHRAQTAFEEAARHPGRFPLRVAGALPFLGRTPDTVVALTDIGRDVSAAGAEVLEAIDRLPGGLASLGPNQGRIPVAVLGSLAPAVHRARTVLDRALVGARALPTSWVLGSVAEARDLVRFRLGEADAAARAADELLRVLPELAGADGRVHTYFVAPQNLTEERGTGGIIGNFGLVTVTDGRLRVGRFSNIGELPTLPPSAIQPPSPEYARLYNSFGGAGFWLNLNMTPDAPTAGQLLENLYEKVRGRRVDGTLFVDLFAMARMLEATGPVHVPKLDATLTERNLVPFVAQARYLGAFPNAETVGPRLIAEAIIRRFFSSTPPKAALLALVESAADGHLLLHARDPHVEAAIRAAGLAGEFGTRDGDFFSLVGNNAAGNKVDYYLRRSVRYAVRLGDGGRARVHAAVTFTNLVPSGVKRSYTLGPYPGLDLVPGENQAWTSFYCSSRCLLERATEEGRPLELGYYRELGSNRYSWFLRLKPQETRTVNLDLDPSGGWAGDQASGTYRLVLQGPPTIAPTPVELTVDAPPGMSITWTSEPMRVLGGRATWRGTLAGRHALEFAFAEPMPGRLLTRIRSFLSRPVFRV